jgi:DNA ligase 1
MKQFAELYALLDETTKTGEKVAAMAGYFASAPPGDAAWAVYFLSGRKPRQLVPNRKLVDWAIEEAGIPDWLFAESYDTVGDMAETITLLLPEGRGAGDLPLQAWVEGRLLPLGKAGEAEQKQALLAAWRELDSRQRFVLNKLITGAFRVGVSQQLVVQALAQASGVDAKVIAHRMMGEWEPSAAFFEQLLASEAGDAFLSRPYPFFLAYPLEGDPQEQLGETGDWQVEWKWDGIRAQLVRRAGQSFLWSRGEELVTGRYPEVVEASGSLPDGTVMDGELLPWKDGGVMPLRSCSSASAARRWARSCWPRSRSSSWPSTCWNEMGRTCAASPCPGAGGNSKN